MSVAEESDAAAVTASMGVWRQGDCALDSKWMIHRFKPGNPLSEEARDVDDGDIDLVEDEVLGFVVVTQTCDVIKDSRKRPFLQVSPLIEVSDDVLQETRSGYRPAYAYIPGVADRMLVADLDKVMTVEKAVAVDWARTPGWQSISEERAVALALARHRMRPALPDFFQIATRRLQERVKEKHTKLSAEGRALRSLREIRVHAAPSWNDPLIEVTIYFVKGDDDVRLPHDPPTPEFVARWIALVACEPPLERVHGVYIDLEDLRAREYVDSDPLDLDHLSSSQE